VEDLFHSKPEDPHAKRRRYAVSGVAFVILMSAFVWYYYLRFLNEQRAVTSFMNAVVAGKYEAAYQIWKPGKSYTFDRFLADWGEKGYYGPVKSYRIVGRPHFPAGGGSGTIVVVEISPDTAFPDEKDTASAKTRYVVLRVESKDLSFNFDPSSP
jgi:hypothetical protein